MKISSFVFSAAAPLPPIFITAGMLALCNKGAIPPLWFFLALWMLFTLLILGILIKKKNMQEAGPSITDSPPYGVKTSPAMEEEQQKGPPAKMETTSPGPFIPSPVVQHSVQIPPEPQPVSFPEKKKEADWKQEVLIDDTIIKRHIILGEDFVRKLFDIFVEDSPARLDEMKESCEKNTFDSLRNAAHALKGSAAAIGAKRLSGICLKIQQDCDGKEFKKIPELLGEAREIFEETQTAVKNYDFSRLEN